MSATFKSHNQKKKKKEKENKTKQNKKKKTAEVPARNQKETSIAKIK